MVTPSPSAALALPPALLIGLVEEFQNGRLNIANGTSLRQFLARMLHCRPKRISKKFERNDYTQGKKFYEKSREEITKQELHSRQRHLSNLEREYKKSLERNPRPYSFHPNYRFGGGARGSLQQQQQQQQQQPVTNSGSSVRTGPGLQSRLFNGTSATAVSSLINSSSLTEPYSVLPRQQIPGLTNTTTATTSSRYSNGLSASCLLQGPSQASRLSTPTSSTTNSSSDNLFRLVGSSSNASSLLSAELQAHLLARSVLPRQGQGPAQYHPTDPTSSSQLLTQWPTTSSSRRPNSNPISNNLRRSQLDNLLLQQLQLRDMVTSNNQQNMTNLLQLVGSTSTNGSHSQGSGRAMQGALLSPSQRGPPTSALVSSRPSHRYS